MHAYVHMCVATFSGAAGIRAVQALLLNCQKLKKQEGWLSPTERASVSAISLRHNVIIWLPHESHAGMSLMHVRYRKWPLTITRKTKTKTSPDPNRYRSRSPDPNACMIQKKY